MNATLPRTAILGLGSIGLRHARNLRSLGVADLIGMDPDSDRRERFVREFGGRAAADIHGALAMSPALAVVASPNRFHVEQALAAAAAGCHLFVEKPLGVTRDGIDALMAEVGRRGLFAHVGSNWKFHPAFRLMKRLLDEGAVGRVTGAQVLAGQWLPDWHPWEDYRRGYSARADLGGGIVLDSHEFDYLPWLLGPVAAITGYTAHSGCLEISTEDVAVATLRFDSGALATVQVDYIQRHYRRRYHISGDAGTIEWDYSRGTVAHYSAASNTTREYQAGLADINAMYVEQMAHVLDGVAGRASPVTPLAAAARTLDLLLTLKESNG